MHSANNFSNHSPEIKRNLLLFLATDRSSNHANLLWNNSPDLREFYYNHENTNDLDNDLLWFKQCGLTDIVADIKNNRKVLPITHSPIPNKPASLGYYAPMEPIFGGLGIFNDSKQFHLDESLPQIDPPEVYKWGL